ncbi:MAG: AAA family ATPase [Planctomycetota bacterium]
MKTILRKLTIDLPRGQSAFLWGPRKTGKSTYLKTVFPQSIVYDFLKTDLMLELAARPHLLREQLLARPERDLAEPVILDEVQKVPRILDEVHWLIENKGLRFILCGSSARKLKKSHANLLGGRAWRFEMFPLTTVEVGEVDLLRVLNNGLIPAHYLQTNAERSLKGYVQDYLTEEIIGEAMTRNLPAFARFFESAAFSHGQLVNYTNIARECGVDSKTVKEYYQILVDTLVGTLIQPYKRRQHRQVITATPRFYLFDVGVAGALMRRRILIERGEDFGRALEHFILMELLAHRSYSGTGHPIHFWRTKTGLEVDFILGDQVAVEVKGTAVADRSDLKGLRALAGEFPAMRPVLVCCEKTRRTADGVTIMPWREFLSELWNGSIIR